VIVKGKPGQAAFFHYLSPSGTVDMGWTKHSSCPVLEGTKWVAVQWIRHGVSKNDPWHHFTPTGDRDYTPDAMQPDEGDLE